jgi:AraC-like DNA-binding protein
VYSWNAATTIASPSDWDEAFTGLVRRERLRLARTRLAGPSWTAVPIAQIAHSCGFGSHAAFATAFRQEFGMTVRRVASSADVAIGGVAGGRLAGYGCTSSSLDARTRTCYR